MRALVLVVAVVACQQEPIGVKKGALVADYNRGALQAAITKFVTAGKTATAYEGLWRTILELRPGMDRQTAELAELELVTLALGPMKDAANKPMPEQIATMGTTVWPALLTKEIEPDEILRKRDPKVDEILPRKDEAPAAWLLRVCGAQLATDCKGVVPEFHGHVVAALATRRGIERARNALADCMLCDTEPGWKVAVDGWADLDHDANMWIHEIERQSDPANWPIAGAASIADPDLPEAEIANTGEVIVGGQRYGAPKRLEALREVRFMHGDDSPIALHLRPELTIAQVKGILADTRKSGAKKMAVIARSTDYPWERRIYWVSELGGVRAGLRPTDTLQLLLHAIDHLGEPGSTAWVE